MDSPRQTTPCLLWVTKSLADHIGGEAGSPLSNLTSQHRINDLPVYANIGVETQPMSRLDVGKGRIERKENFMAIRASLRLTLCTVASLFVSGVAFAQETGTTTGPAAGK